MKSTQTIGSENSLFNLSKALPTTSEAHALPLWTLSWTEISHLTSPVFEIALADDKWRLPETIFREGSSGRKSPFKRLISFEPLRKAARASQVEAVVRRAKRMVWMYLHMPVDKILAPTTLVVNSRNFIAMLVALAENAAFHIRPNDSCPDGPVLFRDLTKDTFEQSIPAGRLWRNGIFLLAALPPAMDDQLRFTVETYSKYAKRVISKKNEAKGRPSNAVSYNSVDDQNLSRLLHVCNTYRRYPDLLEMIWTWLEGHRACALATGESNDIYWPNGKRKKGANTEILIKAELLRPNLLTWKASGIVTDDDGTLAIPVYTRSGDPYRSVRDLVSTAALKSCIQTIFYTNAVFLAFLTGIRDREITALPFDALIPIEDKASIHDQLVGYDLKNNNEIDGIPRDWPLPKVAHSLVIGVQKLHGLRARMLGDAIPRLLFDWSTNVPEPFGRLLREECGYTGPTDHLLKRMRPSSAQLVADIARTPLAVQKVLGHRTIEQGLGYRQGRPDDEYLELIEQKKRERDREMGRKMIGEVCGKGGTDRMSRGVIKMALDQIVALNLGEEGVVKYARMLQAKIDKVKPQHFSEVYEMLGETRWTVDEFIGESVAQPRPYQFCTAKKGGANFSGACTSNDNSTNPRNCKSYCPYNFEALASLELRAKWVEQEIARGHFHRDDITTEDPLFYNSAMKILDWINGFEGPLAQFKDDLRLKIIMEKIAQDDDLVSVFKGEARRTMRELGVR